MYHPEIVVSPKFFFTHFFIRVKNFQLSLIDRVFFFSGLIYIAIHRQHTCKICTGRPKVCLYLFFFFLIERDLLEIDQRESSDNQRFHLWIHFGNK